MKRRLEAYASFTEEFGKEDKRPICPVCEEMYDIDVYKQLNTITFEERNKILQKKRLCFTYFSPIPEDQNAKNCKNRKTYNK